MAGRKPIVSARQLKARVQIIMRATDKDVAQNTEKNRLIDMTESMREAGVLQEFLLDCLRSKLRQDEGQNVAVYRMFEGGQSSLPQRPTDSQIHYQQQHAPNALTPSFAEPVAPVAVDEPESSLPVSQRQESYLAPTPSVVPTAEVEARNSGAFVSTPSEIIESVVREIESAATSNETGITTTPSAERRKPRGNLLGAMG